MKRIALLIGSEIRDYGGDLSGFLGKTISDFTEVSDEEYIFLRSNLYRLNNYPSKDRHLLVEQLSKEEIFATIEDLRKKITADKEREDKAEALRKKKAQAVKDKVAAKKLADSTKKILSGDRIIRKQIFAKLKEEFEGEQNSG